MSKQIRKTALIGLMILLAASVNAQPRGHKGQGAGQGYNQEFKGGTPGMDRFDRMAEMLELSDEQKEKIDDLRIDHLEKMLPKRNAMQEKRARLNTLESENPANIKAINTLIDEMADLKAEIMKERVAHHQAIRNLLTDEQRIKFDTHKSQHGKRSGKGMHGGKGRGHCKY